MTEPSQAGATPQRREISLIMGTIVYFIGTLGTSLLQFLIVPVITRLLTGDEYAYYDLMYSAILLLVPVLTLQGLEALFRMLMDAREEERAPYLSAVGMLCIVGIAAFGALVFVANRLTDLIHYPLSLFLYFAGTVGYQYYQKVARSTGRNKLYMGMSIVQTGLLLGLQLLLLLRFGMKTEALLIAGAASTLLAALLYEILLRVRTKVSLAQVTRASFREILRFGAPLIPQSVSWWSVTQVNRFIMVGILDMTVVGVYSMAFKFNFIVSMLTGVFTMAWNESAIRESGAADRDAYYNQTFGRYMRFLMSMLLVLLPVTPFIAPIMLGKEFIAGQAYIPWVYLSALFEAFMGFMGSGYVVSKRTAGSSVTVVIGSVLNIAFVFACVRGLGVYAALFGSILAFLLIWLLRLYDLRNVMHIRVDLRAFGILAVLIALFIAGYYLAPMWAMPLLILLGSACFLYVNRAMIAALWNGVWGFRRRGT